MLNIINYITRILIVAVGIIFTTGLIAPQDGDIARYRIMGIVFILFGLYRLVMYRMKSRQYNFNAKDEDEDND